MLITYSTVVKRYWKTVEDILLKGSIIITKTSGSPLKLIQLTLLYTKLNMPMVLNDIGTQEDNKIANKLVI